MLAVSPAAWDELPRHSQGHATRAMRVEAAIAGASTIRDLPFILHTSCFLPGSLISAADTARLARSVAS